MIATGVVAITLLGVVGISIGRYAGKNPVNMNAITDSMSVIGQTFNQGFDFVSDQVSNLLDYNKNADKVNELEDSNSELKREVIELNNQINEMESLQTLKDSLNYVDEEYKPQSISASIVGKNDGNWYNSFTIGAGSKDGVKQDSVIINGQGLVGVVYEVSENYSKAISILDTKSSVSFRLLKDGVMKGVITQNTNMENNDNYKEQGLLQGYMFDSKSDVLPGDSVVTSGLGLYPEGIPIGEVDKVIDDKNKSLKYVIVKPYTNFKNIDDVLIVNPRSN